VEGFGGRIWAEPRDGGGSTFTFSLPIAPDAVDGLSEALPN
jgi:signal transduction histidine kinase